MIFSRLILKKTYSKPMIAVRRRAGSEPSTRRPTTAQPQPSRRLSASAESATQPQPSRRLCLRLVGDSAPASSATHASVRRVRTQTVVVIAIGAGMAVPFKDPSVSAL